MISGKDLEALSDDPDELSSELSALAGPSAGPNGGQIYVDGFTGGQLPPKSSIREIRINQNPFSAQYDRLGFGRVEVFTKPGTDKFHGSFQANGNPSQFNSGNPLQTVATAPYHTVFMFGNLTGPLSKSASFSVGGSHRDIEDASFTNATILAPSAGSITPCNPGQAGCVQTQAQFSTNTPQIRTDISPRFDFALGEKNVLTARFQYVQNDSLNGGIGNLALPSVALNSNSKTAEIQLSDTQTWSSKLINETRFEWERNRTSSNPLSTAPSVTVSGAFSTGGSSTGFTLHSDHFEVQNYTSVQIPKNFIRFGGRLRINRDAATPLNNTNGAFTYSSLAAYAAGTPSQFTLTRLNVRSVGLHAFRHWPLCRNGLEGQAEPHHQLRPALRGAELPQRSQQRGPAPFFRLWRSQRQREPEDGDPRRLRDVLRPLLLGQRVQSHPPERAETDGVHDRHRAFHVHADVSGFLHRGLNCEQRDYLFAGARHSCAVYSAVRRRRGSAGVSVRNDFRQLSPCGRPS